MYVTLLELYRIKIQHQIIKSYEIWMFLKLYVSKGVHIANECS